MNARKKSLYAIIFFLCLLPLNAQTGRLEDKAVIIGTVVNDSTNAPIEDVNVFISGTMIGASTDKNGHYEIKHVPFGNYELVASMVGYEVKIRPVYIKEIKNEFNFRLVSEPFSLESIEVVAERPVKWLKDEKFFENLLFGVHDFSNECFIENKEILEFDHPQKGLLVAKASRPLLIVNKALGYRIYFVLKTFNFRTTGGRLTYTFKHRFEEMKPENEREKQRWMENRKIAYAGSPRHFFKSMFDNKVHENGFRVFHVRQISYKDKNDNKFEVLNPYNYFIIPGLIESEREVKFTNYMKIKYEPSATAISTFASRIERDSREQISWISLKYPSITIDKDGHVQELLPYELFGYWSRLGISTMLPRGYDPGN